MDQVLGANLVDLRITELDKERTRREALKAQQLERGEEVRQDEKMLARRRWRLPPITPFTLAALKAGERLGGRLRQR